MNAEQKVALVGEAQETFGLNRAPPVRGGWGPVVFVPLIVGLGWLPVVAMSS